jgi:hypothetical protein
MKAFYVIALAIFGDGVYLLAHGKTMEGFGEIVFAAGGLIALLAYQYAEREKEIKRKRRALKPYRRPGS